MGYSLLASRDWSDLLCPLVQAARRLVVGHDPRRLEALGRPSGQHLRFRHGRAGRIVRADRRHRERQQPGEVAQRRPADASSAITSVVSAFPRAAIMARSVSVSSMPSPTPNFPCRKEGLPFFPTD